MDQKHLDIICSKFKLGLPLDEISSVYGSRGGSFIWKVKTEKGCFAFKQLAPELDLESERMVSKYELSELIAYRFAQHEIPAVCALQTSGHRLLKIDNTGYLVYPWGDGNTLARDEISETHALKMAELVAKLHIIDLKIPDVKPAPFDIHSNKKIIEAIIKAKSKGCPFIETLKENQEIIGSLGFAGVSPN